MRNISIRQAAITSNKKLMSSKDILKGTASLSISMVMRSTESSMTADIIQLSKIVIPKVTKQTTHLKPLSQLKVQKTANQPWPIIVRSNTSCKSQMLISTI